MHTYVIQGCTVHFNTALQWGVTMDTRLTQFFPAKEEILPGIATTYIFICKPNN